MMEVLLTSDAALCFDKNDFARKDFCWDKFISDYRKFSSLEKILEDLNLYHKLLCASMIELINKDYGDFVNLSSYLFGLDKSIKNLSKPLEIIKAEIRDNKNKLDEKLKRSNSLFSNYNATQKKKIVIHHALLFLESLKKSEDSHFLLNERKMTHTNIDDLERIALELNVTLFYVKKIANFEIIESKQMLIEKILQNLTDHLEKLFVQSLSSRDAHLLTQILHIYTILGKEEELEKFYSDCIVHPYMMQLISEENILNLGLAKVYDSIINFILSPECSFVLDVTGDIKRSSEPASVPDCDFLVKSIFPQVLHYFELIAPVHVFAPGDPNVFHANYTSTITFLECFEHFCSCETSSNRLYKHELYQKFTNKFNLDVYFLMRFEEIAGQLEKSLSNSKTFMYEKEEKEEKGKGYFLDVSYSLAECVKLCWDSKIFLPPLSHKFFCLTLQLISRFCKSACFYFTHSCHNEKPVLIADAAAIIQDIEALVIEFTNIFENNIAQKVSRNLIEAAFEESIVLLKDIIPVAHSFLVKHLTTQCNNHLKSISDIPRLYRKTNREVSSKPSNYVSLVFDCLTNFLSATDSILSADYKELCLQEVADEVVTNYITKVKDVLVAIKKMEDSLKILKRVQEKSPKYSSQSMSDDDKIRHQLSIDTKAMVGKVHLLIGERACESMKSVKELKDLGDSIERKMNVSQDSA